MDQAALIGRLRKRCDRYSQRQVAEELGISQAYLSDILAGKREPGPAVLAGLGVTRRVIYQPTNGT